MNSIRNIIGRWPDAEVYLIESPGNFHQCYPSLGDFIKRGNPSAFHAKKRSSDGVHASSRWSHRTLHAERYKERAS